MEVVKIFQEDDRSGMFSDNREQFLAMLKCVECSEIDAIVAVRYDRIARDIGIMAETSKFLNQKRMLAYSRRRYIS